MTEFSGLAAALICSRQDRRWRRRSSSVRARRGAARPTCRISIHSLQALPDSPPSRCPPGTACTGRAPDCSSRPRRIGPCFVRMRLRRATAFMSSTISDSTTTACEPTKLPCCSSLPNAKESGMQRQHSHDPLRHRGGQDAAGAGWPRRRPEGSRGARPTRVSSVGHAAAELVDQLASTTSVTPAGTPASLPPEAPQIGDFTRIPDTE